MDALEFERHLWLVAKIAQRLRNWVGLRSQFLDLERAGEDLEEIAKDLALAVADFRHSVDRDPNATTLLHHMIAALHFDPAAVPTESLRDLQRVCAECAHKIRCTCDLASGCVATTYRDYCPNAEMLHMLQFWMEKKLSMQEPQLHESGPESSGSGGGVGPRQPAHPALAGPGPQL
jgi:hypothetical protein